MFPIEILKVATVDLDDSFTHYFHCLRQLHELVSWNAFQLTGKPCLKIISGIAFEC